VFRLSQNCANFFRGYARKKWPLRGSMHADFRFQVSGFGCQGVEVLNPETWTLTPDIFSFLQHVVRKNPLRA